MGPLKGVRIVEMAGIGPAPFCGMLLADLGADVIRVGRLEAVDIGFGTGVKYDLLNRGKRAVAVDLKSPQGVALVKELAASADILIEGFRPGVMERLGLGPDVCLAINPRLVFGRMTGWGQDGPLKNLAGHDINYIALTGALNAIGPSEGPPVAPLNLVADFGGGALYLAMGVLAALTEARASGKGQAVDAAMIDGVASLMSMHLGFRQSGFWNLERESNALDGGAPYYSAYRTRDGKFVAVGAIEQRFYLELLERLGLKGEDIPGRGNPKNWPALRQRFAAIFAARTRDEWAALFADGDACVTPVLDMDEARAHPHVLERGMYIEADGVIGPAPAPRFSRTKSKVRNPPLDPREDSADALRAWGISGEKIAKLAADGVIAAKA